MKSRTALLLAILALALAGCAGAPQASVDLQPQSVGPNMGRVGVAMTALPRIDTHFPGAGCLLCLAAANLAHSSLTTHTQKLPYEDLPTLKEQVAALVRKKGGEVTIISEEFKTDGLQTYRTEGVNIARKDFTSLKQKYNVDKIVVLDIWTLGISRAFSSYFPTGEPRGVFLGMGYLVNLTTNTYEWYRPVSIYQGATGAWDEPPSFPGLTNAYYQALELGKDAFLAPFAK